MVGVGLHQFESLIIEQAMSSAFELGFGFVQLVKDLIDRLFLSPRQIGLEIVLHGLNRVGGSIEGWCGHAEKNVEHTRHRNLLCSLALPNVAANAMNHAGFVQLDRLEAVFGGQSFIAVFTIDLVALFSLCRIPVFVISVRIGKTEFSVEQAPEAVEQAQAGG